MEARRFRPLLTFAEPLSAAPKHRRPSPDSHSLCLGFPLHSPSVNWAHSALSLLSRRAIAHSVWQTPKASQTFRSCDRNPLGRLKL